MSHILLRRLQLNVLTARFWAGFFLLVVLSLLALNVSLDDYRQRRHLFETQRNADLEAIRNTDSIRVYLSTRTVLHRPPQPMSVLAQGLGESYGSVARLRGKYGEPAIASRAASNFLLPGLGAIDFSYVVTVVLTLMAILLSADVLAGEREFGTLQLILAHSMPRWKVAMGEFLGVWVSLMLPLTIVFLLAALMVSSSDALELSAEMAVRMMTLMALLAAATGVFVLIGLWISASFQHSSTALTMGFFAWIALVALYPNASGWIVRESMPVTRVAFVQGENAVTRAAGIPPEEGDQLARQQLSDFRTRNLERARLVDRAWTWAPFSSALSTARRIAGTDLIGHRRFLSQARRLEESLLQWQSAKLEKYPRREKGFIAEFGPLDLSGLPEGRYEAESFSDMLSDIGLRFAGIAVWALLAFLGLHFTFSRYDVRSG